MNWCEKHFRSAQINVSACLTPQSFLIIKTREGIPPSDPMIPPLQFFSKSVQETAKEKWSGIG